MTLGKYSKPAARQTGSRFRIAALGVLGVGLAGGPALAHDADVIFVHAEVRAAGPDALEVDERFTLTAATLGLLAPVDADGDGVLTQEDLDARADALRAGVLEDAPLASSAGPCVLGQHRAVLQPTHVEVRAAWRCPLGELGQDFRLLRVLPPNYQVALGRQGEPRAGRPAAQGQRTSLPLWSPAPAAPAAATPGVASWAVLLACALLLMLFEARSK